MISRKSIRARIFAFLTATFLLLFGFNPNQAMAAEPAEIASELLVETSEYLEIEPSAELLGELTEDMVDAIEADQIDADLIDQVEEAIDSETELELADELDENAQEQNDVLEEAEPLWKAAFDLVKEEFQLCRQASENASACAKGLGFRLQVAKATGQLAQIQTAIAEVANLPADQRETALLELQNRQSDLERQLARATEKSNKVSPDASEAAGVEQAKADLEKTKGASDRVNKDIDKSKASIEKGPKGSSDKGNGRGSSEPDESNESESPNYNSGQRGNSGNAGNGGRGQ